MVIYLWIMAVGYLTFGTAAEGLILNNYSEKAPLTGRGGWKGKIWCPNRELKKDREGWVYGWKNLYELMEMLGLWLIHRTRYMGFINQQT